MIFRFFFSLFSGFVFAGCAVLSQDSHYKGPAVRPPALDTYYSRGSSYSKFHSKFIETKKSVTISEITIESEAGQIIVDYYQSPQKSQDLVLVFPLLGGKPIVSQHFAEYFAENKIDAAIVRRNNDFKNPANFLNIEETLRLNVVRDRIALDFFEKEKGKKNFGGFGVSRGAQFQQSWPHL
jgi:hypothetical protein